MSEIRQYVVRVLHGGSPRCFLEHAYDARDAAAQSFYRCDATKFVSNGREQSFPFSVVSVQPRDENSYNDFQRYINRPWSPKA